jgi:hypothetical protein
VNRAALAALCCMLVSGCATVDVQRAIAPGMASAEVLASVGKPTAAGKLVDGSEYWDYSRQPYHTERVSFGADGRVRDLRNLLTDQNFAKLQKGMTLDEVRGIVGPTFLYGEYADRTTVWTYRYQDTGIWKLLHVTMGPDGRMVRYETEWDPEIYSKKDRGGSR